MRPLTRLATSFGLAWVAIAMVAAPGPAAYVALSGRAADAGVFFAIFSVAAAAGGGLIGRAMDRYGRRDPLVVAHVIAALGFGVAGLAYRAGSLPGFVAGDIMLAFGIGGIYLTRVAAAELFGPAERARGVARVQVAAAVSAVAGPLVLVALAARATELVWFVAPPLYLASAFIIRGWDADRPAPGAPSAGAPSSTSSASSLPPGSRAPFAVAVLALVCAQGAMVTIMGVTGVELRHAGHSSLVTGLVMSLHFLGMFGLSLVVGRVADRIGRRGTILVGVLIMALGGALVAFLAGAIGLALGLLLVGLGWSFAYIGGTVLLTEIVPAARRARTVGLVDLTNSLLSALASFAGGLWYAERGMVGLGLAAIAIVALPALAALRLRQPSAERIVQRAGGER